MRRTALIFFASILLPSLVLAWLAMRSVRDQQVVLEHQQAIICQNITDALAKSIQGQMDGVRADFAKTTQQLLDGKASPQILAQNFNHTLREAWPTAEIGFAVNVNGQIYSPTPYDGPEARTFRDENDRFLSNRENVEVYTANSNLVTQSDAATQLNVAQNAVMQNAASELALKLPPQAQTHAVTQVVTEKKEAEADLKEQADANEKARAADANSSTRESDFEAKDKSVLRGQMDARLAEVTTTTPPAPAATGSVAALPAGEAVPDASAEPAMPLKALSAPTAAAAKTMPALAPTVAVEDSLATKNAETFRTRGPAPVPAEPAADAPAPQSISASTAMPAAPLSPAGGESQTVSAPIVMTSPLPTSDVSGGFSADTTTAATQTPSVFGKIARQVIPQQTLARDTASISNTVPEESDFRRIIGTQTSGELARFLEDKMRLLVWLHPSADAPIVFGAQLDRDKLVETLQSSLHIGELAPSSLADVVPSREPGLCAAILDDTGHPVALSRPGFIGDWKHPFVATEIGEVLPHWEAALYLVDPQQFSRAARTLQWSFFFIVILLIAAIVAGGSFIGRDVRREMLLAQQKTDFVSNVSHELKTPLTSIRMFADLLAEKRVPDEERQATYLRIIAAEASRLTRLINNVLDFARLEKGAPHGEHAACDLVEAVRDVADTCGPHLEAAGVSFQCEIEAETLPISGDRDALAQIILNLISNAEKYGGNDILVRVRRQEIATGALGCVDVLDRGAGIPARQVKTIFEPFHRLDDSLSSGIPGSGLGLTLARRMARVHGGDITYSARAGGGSCFTLAVPLV